MIDTTKKTDVNEQTSQKTRTIALPNAAKQRVEQARLRLDKKNQNEQSKQQRYKAQKVKLRHQRAQEKEDVQRYQTDGFKVDGYQKEGFKKYSDKSPRDNKSGFEHRKRLAQAHSLEGDHHAEVQSGHQQIQPAQMNKNDPWQSDKAPTDKQQTDKQGHTNNLNGRGRAELPRQRDRLQTATQPKPKTIYKPKRSLNLRAQVAQLLLVVDEGQSLQQLLDPALQHLSDKDKGLFHELIMGVLRRWFQLDAVVAYLTNQKPVSEVVEVLLKVGLYQLLFTRVAEHAAINETVLACKQLNQINAAGLVNAVLRRTLREQDDISHLVENAPILPAWMQQKLQQQWPQQAQEITQASLFVPPIFLRTNAQKTTALQYLAVLQAHEIEAQSFVDIAPHALQLQQHKSISALPFYNEGYFSVQDLHAQLMQTLLPNLNNQVVIDACCAPGGKLAAMLEMYQPKVVYGLDVEASRLARTEQNLQRLQLLNDRVNLQQGDATKWQSPQAADFIVVDAPCTATGVMRRHPDMLLLRKPSDVQQTTALQSQILQNMWNQLKVGGHLLYMTCSVFKDENEQQMQHFLNTNTNAQEVKMQALWGIDCNVGKQLLPTVNGGDGFYYALLCKVGT